MHDASFTRCGLLRMQIGLANFCNFILRTDEKPITWLNFTSCIKFN